MNKNRIAFLIACVTVVLLTCIGCHRYYKVLAVSPVNNTKAVAGIDSLKTNNRYFVLRSGNHAYYMDHLVLSNDRQTLECTLDTLSYFHQLHLHNGRKGKMQYRKGMPQELAVLSEVHIYIPDDPQAALGKYSLPLNNVQKMEVIVHDKKRTTNSYVIGAIGYTLGAAIVVGVIIAATKSSCPFVSAYDSSRFSLQGEIYGGAIYPRLARHDYLPLRMSPTPDGTFQLKISNELQEHQFTDMANLIVVTHNRNARVIPDEKGNLYVVKEPQPPLSAVLNSKKNVTVAVSHKDDYSLLYMDDTSYTAGRNEVVLRFNKTGASTKGKLVLSLKNSYWLDYLYGELAKGFGRYYGMYIKQQRKKPAADLLNWVKEQQIPLQVSVKNGEEWKTLSSLNTIGPVATREIVVPIDLPADGNNVEIKLSAGFMFWEIDYAALDYTAPEHFSVAEYAPVTATDEQGKDVLPLLAKEDDRFLAQPEIGNVATLQYKPVLPADSQLTQTFILHTRGYYEHVRHFEGGIDRAFLESFKKPGAFTVFSLNRYKQFRTSELKELTKK